MSTGSCAETTPTGREGNENLEELFFWTFICCICMSSGVILQETESEQFHEKINLPGPYFQLYILLNVITGSHLPVNIHTDLIRVNDGRLSIHLLIIQQSTLNVVDPSQEQI